MLKIINLIYIIFIYILILIYIIDDPLDLKVDVCIFNFVYKNVDK